MSIEIDSKWKEDCPAIPSVCVMVHFAILTSVSLPACISSFLASLPTSFQQDSEALCSFPQVRGGNWWGAGEDTQSAILTGF